MSSAAILPGATVGVLGSGQLGRMFALAARQLGYRMMHEGGSTDADRLRYGFRLVTARPPNGSESAILSETLAAERSHYKSEAKAAQKAISVGEAPVPGDVPASDLAAYTMVANLLLNLDEVVTKN